jgi:uncharacterized protein with HEPN domain
MASWARVDVPVLDDLGLQPVPSARAADLLEVIGDRAGTRSTIVTSQLPVGHWHEALAWRALVGLQDVLIHQYEGVDLERMWTMVERDLPRVRLGIRWLAGDEARSAETTSRRPCVTSLGHASMRVLR